MCPRPPCGDCVNSIPLCSLCWHVVLSPRRFRICDLRCKLPHRFIKASLQHTLCVVCSKSLCTALWCCWSPQSVCLSPAPGAGPQPLLIQLVVGPRGGSPATGEVAGRAGAPPTGLRRSFSQHRITKRRLLLLFIIIIITCPVFCFSGAIPAGSGAAGGRVAQGAPRCGGGREQEVGGNVVQSSESLLSCTPFLS